MVRVYNATGAHIIWEVRWVNKKGKIVIHWCDNDLVEALRVYEAKKAAGKKMVTLRSCNVGFPPAEGWRITKLVKVGSGKDTKWVRKLVKMEAANAKGFWWCPYCREFRKFERYGGFTYKGLVVPDETGRYCPICGVSHRDYHVRKWNPYAARLYNAISRRRGGSKAGTRRKRTR